MGFKDFENKVKNAKAKASQQQVEEYYSQSNEEIDSTVSDSK